MLIPVTAHNYVQLAYNLTSILSVWPVYCLSLRFLAQNARMSAYYARDGAGIYQRLF
jgi:hypothetical protein